MGIYFTFHIIIIFDMFILMSLAANAWFINNLFGCSQSNRKLVNQIDIMKQMSSKNYLFNVTIKKIIALLKIFNIKNNTIN